MTAPHWRRRISSGRLVAVLVVATSLASSTVASSSVSTFPSSPRGVHAVAGDRSAVVTFLSPTLSGTAKILVYRVEAFPTKRVYSCLTTRCRVAGLTNGTTYSFTATAFNKYGPGTTSSMSNKVTPVHPPSTVTFAANGGSGAMAPETANYNTTEPITTNSFLQTGYTFAGWNSAANGSGTAYADGAPLTFTQNLTLYAQWSINSYTVTFAANGGTGAMAPETANYNTTEPITTNSFLQTGYTFAGWNSAANGSGTAYTDGAPLTFTQNLTLYAQWSLIVAPVESPGWRSLNWAGYVLTGQGGGYQQVGAQWSVPALNCSSTTSSSTADWVGVNGWNSSSGLFQTGTSSDCTSGHQSDSAWWTDQSLGYSERVLFSVSPGDVIQAEVYQQAPSDWVYSIKDVTTNQTASAAQYFPVAATSAEWIAEDPVSLSSGNLFTLANFATVTFTDLTLAVPGGTWSLPTYADAIEMIDTSNSAKATPTPVTGTGASASFEVNFESSS